MEKYRHAAHLDILEPLRLRQYLTQAADKIKNSGLIFDTIVFSGASGSLFAPSLALLLEKEMVMVRKRNDRYPVTHSSFGVEGCCAVKKYLIVDDLISSGTSVRFMIRQLSDFVNDADCIGVYCYLQDYFLNDSMFILFKNQALLPARVPAIEEEDDPTVSLFDSISLPSLR